MEKNAPSPSPKKQERLWLVIADLIAVTAILLVYSKAGAGDLATIVATLGVVVAGMFVVIPVLCEKPVAAENHSAETEKITTTLRALADTFNKRQNALEKQIALAAATPANLPALGEIADKIADLSTITSEDGELARIKTSLEEIQAQLDLLTDTLRAVEGKIEKQTPPPAAVASPADEGDGPLPPSLMARAFSGPQTAGGAVSRLIGKASNGEVTPAESDADDDENHAPLGAELDDDADINKPISTVYPKSEYTQPGAMPAEDEIWNAAEDMAGDGAPPAIQQPDMLGELGLPPAEPRPPKNEASLLVNAVVGIGNKPYVRGTGPGLSPDAGVPMEYVGIGRWRWVSPDPTVAAEITVWKNDAIRAKGDPIILPAGNTVEASPVFPEE